MKTYRNVEIEICKFDAEIDMLTFSGEDVNVSWNAAKWDGFFTSDSKE